MPKAIVMTTIIATAFTVQMVEMTMTVNSSSNNANNDTQQRFEMQGLQLPQGRIAAAPLKNKLWFG